ncbi:phosphopantothenoylcysteine decarboxylase, putative [Plasmodium ovale curtisi]|uniref:Phosphopantothenoylcysteine decarboxylase, putative n=1 Tax=Plasmodium ovale curtisi TaxID=864141 RepID=A0A1A8VKT8_PLAOA|nr:phosphopantothenoylcysteine decarboxylase, putative [Plasmodium ovale curtisi]
MYERCKKDHQTAIVRLTEGYKQNEELSMFLSLTNLNTCNRMKLLFGISGSIAAIKTREIVDSLREKCKEEGISIEIKFVATKVAAEKFLNTFEEKVLLDEDEWLWEQRGDVILHIELRRWADIFVICPLDANTLANMASGAWYKQNEELSMFLSLTNLNTCNRMKLLFGISGSIAAIKTREIVDSLREKCKEEGISIEIKFVATKVAAEKFLNTFEEKVLLDEDEWLWEQRGDVILHIELRRWADIFVICPLDANTLANMASGACPNLLVCAKKKKKKKIHETAYQATSHKPPLHYDEVVYHNMSLLLYLTLPRRHAYADAGTSRKPASWVRTPTCTVTVNYTSVNLSLICSHLTLLTSFQVVEPVEKILACGEYGMGALPNVDDVTREIVECLKMSGCAMQGNQVNPTNIAVEWNRGIVEWNPGKVEWNRGRVEWNRGRVEEG